MKGGHRKTLHPGKPSQYHQFEGALRQWLRRRRGRQILVTKKMMIKRAKEVSATIRVPTPTQLEEWWASFRRRRRISARRVSSHRRASEDHVFSLTQRYFGCLQ